MKNGEMIFWIILCIVVAINVITAYFFGEIAKDKGYDLAKYAVLCAFLGLAGWIMVAALPDRSEMDESKEWESNKSKKKKIDKVVNGMDEKENNEMLNEFISKLEQNK